MDTKKDAPARKEKGLRFICSDLENLGNKAFLYVDFRKERLHDLGFVLQEAVKQVMEEKETDECGECDL